jgi:uncharacterized protein (TIGR03437 family)
LNILTPPDPLPASVEVRVNNSGGGSAATVQGFDATHVTAIHTDGTLLAPAALYPGFSTPARPGETVIVYANGLGPVSEPIVSGSPQQSGILPVLPVIRIGDAPARVSFAGLVSPGLYQLNMVVPETAASGDNPITGTYQGVPLQTGVTLAVQR